MLTRGVLHIPSARAEHGERMISRYASSVDSLACMIKVQRCRAHPRSWVACSARITAILNESGLTVLFDGPASGAQTGRVRTACLVKQRITLCPLVTSSRRISLAMMAYSPSEVSE
jgi:hypothetical protein